MAVLPSAMQQRIRGDTASFRAASACSNVLGLLLWAQSRHSLRPSPMTAMRDKAALCRRGDCSRSISSHVQRHALCNAADFTKADIERVEIGYFQTTLLPRAVPTIRSRTKRTCADVAFAGVALPCNCRVHFCRATAVSWKWLFRINDLRGLTCAM